MKVFLSRFLPLLLSMALIFGMSMSHNPYRGLPDGWRGPVQVGTTTVGEVELFGMPGHVIEFTLLGITAGRAVMWRRRSTLWGMMVSFAGCGLYALSDEVHQIFVPGRAFEVGDLLLDGAGIACGLAIVWLVRRRLEARSQRLG